MTLTNFPFFCYKIIKPIKNYYMAFLKNLALFLFWYKSGNTTGVAESVCKKTARNLNFLEFGAANFREGCRQPPSTLGTVLSEYWKKLEEIFFWSNITLRRLWKLYHFEKNSQAFFNILKEPLLVQKQTIHQQKGLDHSY